MRSLAQVFLEWGWQLSGSDLRAESLPGLAASGVRIFQGHQAANVPAQAELVVYSAAIEADNPELRRAADLGIPTLSYFEVLGRLMPGKRGLAIAGTHGKSTAAAMAAEMLIDAHHDPTVVYGAAPLGKSSGGRAGRGEVMLVEACEYRAHFLHLQPQQAIILGVEPDHFDCYDSLEDLERAFARFAASIPESGLILARADCASTRRAVAGLTCRVETFGCGDRADWSARNIGQRWGRYRFDLLRHGRLVCRVVLQVPGGHNVLNALAAAALAWHNGVEPLRIARVLRSFHGLERRLQVVGSWRDVTIVDDYAHHPTEAAAALRTVRQMFPGRRVWCVFQPHQVCRTACLLDELAESLQNTDRLLVTDIFRAREPIRSSGEVTAADLAQRVRDGGGEVAGVHATDEIIRFLERGLTPGDVLITMGAGDVAKIWQALVDRFATISAAA